VIKKLDHLEEYKDQQAFQESQPASKEKFMSMLDSEITGSECSTNKINVLLPS